MSNPTYERDSVDLREKLAHIDQMLADHDRKRQEIKLAVWQIALGGAAACTGLMAAGAALFAAALAFLKVFDDRQHRTRSCDLKPMVGFISL
jgi:hypothetical protein